MVAIKGLSLGESKRFKEDIPEKISITQYWQLIAKKLSTMCNGQLHRQDYVRDIYNGLRDNKGIKDKIMISIELVNADLKKNNKQVIPYLRTRQVKFPLI